MQLTSSITKWVSIELCILHPFPLSHCEPCTVDEGREGGLVHFCQLLLHWFTLSRAPFYLTPHTSRTHIARSHTRAHHTHTHIAHTHRAHTSLFLSFAHHRLHPKKNLQVPTDFFLAHLGPKLKYSSCEFEKPDGGLRTLAEASLNTPSC